MITEWAEEHDALFLEAVEAIDEDLHENGASFEGSLAHYADLFEITPQALRHEWDLRHEASL